MGKRAAAIRKGIGALGLALIPISYLLLTYAEWWTAPVASALIVLLARVAWPDRWAEALGLRIPLAQIGASVALLCIVAGASSGVIAAITEAEGIAFTPVWESQKWASALVHTVGQTLNEEMVLGALLLRAVRSRLKSIHPLATSAAIALAFSLAHYAFYRARPSWAWNYGTLSVATLASLFAIGVVRNNCILSTGNIGYAWAIHLGWNAIFINGTYRWPESNAKLAEPAMFNAILGHITLAAVSVALTGLSLLLFSKKASAASDS
ncbi:MAG: CPBP family intramembrane metalloprotease [Anaerolineae bacterium]|nr:CPBP family intramembrane metalloprotease [Anaerolineae bacterium]